MNFPLSTAFIVSHRFWVVVFSFSLVSMHILISFLISSVICWLFRSVLFNLHMLELGVQKSDIKVLSGPHSSEGSREESVPGLSPSFWGSLVLWLHSSRLHVASPCVPASVFTFPVFIRTSVAVLVPTCSNTS